MSEVNQHQSKKLPSRWEIIIMLCLDILQHEIESEKKLNELLFLRNKLIQKYENLYKNDSPDGVAVDSKKSIQCLSNKIDQLLNERNFYYLVQCIDTVFPKIEYHLENFFYIELEESIFLSISNALKIHKESLNILKSAAIEFSNIIKLDEYTNKCQMERWAILMEGFAKELKPNILFFPFEILTDLETIFKPVLCKTIRKNFAGSINFEGSIKPNKEEYRRRLHYSANFILDIIDQGFSTSVNSSDLNSQEAEDNQKINLDLDAKDSLVFFNSFLNPPLPNEASKKAALYYKQVMSA